MTALSDFSASHFDVCGKKRASEQNQQRKILSSTVFFSLAAVSLWRSSETLFFALCSSSCSCAHSAEKRRRLPLKPGCCQRRQRSCAMMRRNTEGVGSVASLLQRKQYISCGARLPAECIHCARVLCEPVFSVVSVFGCSRRFVWRKQQRATASFSPPFTGIERASCIVLVFWLIIGAFSDVNASPKVNHLVKAAQKERPLNSCRHNDEQAPRALPQGLPQLSTALPRLRRGGLAVVCRRRRKL